MSDRTALPAGAAAWINTPQPVKSLRPMLVKVHSVPPSDAAQRFEYEGLFNSTFDAYDDALNRFPFAQRIETEYVPSAACKAAAAADRSAA